MVAALPVGVLVGLLAGGDFGELRDLRLRLWPVLLPALGVAAVISLDNDPPFERFLLPLSLVGFAVVVFANLHVVGMAVVGTGILANLAPVLLNGDMPVRESAVIGAGIATADTVEFVELGAGRRFEEAADLLSFLGAIIPVGVLNEVLTFGDLIVVVGLLNVGFRAVRPAAARIQAGNQQGLATAPIIDLREQLDLRPTPQQYAQPGHPPVPQAPPSQLPTSVEGSASWDL